jgi:hypothetical protein
MHEMNAYIHYILLTPEVDEVQVDDELDDLHSSQVFLPLEGPVSKNIRVRVAQTADPYLGATSSGIIIVICCRNKTGSWGDHKVHLHIRT